jgi:hypothetical protein
VLAAPRLTVPRACLPGGGPQPHAAAVASLLEARRTPTHPFHVWARALPLRPGAVGLVEAAAAGRYVAGVRGGSAFGHAHSNIL